MSAGDFGAMARLTLASAKLAKEVVTEENGEKITVLKRRAAAFRTASALFASASALCRAESEGLGATFQGRSGAEVLNPDAAEAFMQAALDALLCPEVKHLHGVPNPFVEVRRVAPVELEEELEEEEEEEELLEE